MTRILKLKLPPHGEGEVRTNGIVRWLDVGWQFDQLVAWVEAAAGEQEATRVYVAQTGEAVPDRSRHVGSAQLMGPGGPYVVHVYVPTP